MAEILVTGGQGQVGIELAARGWPNGVRLSLPTRDELDISDAGSVRAFLAGRSFAAVINCAAYTAVDKAESDIGAAFAVNALGPALLAEAFKSAGTPIVHISTDYVFDGAKDEPYLDSDPINPLGVYGASKEAGEQAIRGAAARAVILRTAWVVSPHRANFIKTMLRVGAERPVLRVVADQRGCPTSAKDLAGAAAEIALRLIADDRAPTGTYHFVNGGDTTWHGLACRVFETASRHGGPSPTVEAIATAEYPTPAKRPANSRLSTARLTADFGIVPRPWQDATDEIVDALIGGKG
ncbi:MAG TPA: dTDP-4-dehydrorhamnose reductase [Alphaproteobacteria bacterium]|jgi:dTDP-4-dehydrorhamnose reductase|nr:dTDP-4-dehydrorhamnose reductase [Alphaproteobacteria bacterium]